MFVSPRGYIIIMYIHAYMYIHVDMYIHAYMYIHVDIPRPLSNDFWVFLFQKVDA